MTLSSEEVEVNLCTVQGIFSHNKIDDHLSNVILKVEFTKNVAMQWISAGNRNVPLLRNCLLYCLEN